MARAWAHSQTRWVWKITAAVVIIFSYSSLPRQDVRGVSKQVLVIHLPRTSPALAAVEDCLRDFKSFHHEDSASSLLFSSQIHLVSGSYGWEELRKNLSPPQEVPQSQNSGQFAPPYFKKNSEPTGHLALPKQIQIVSLKGLIIRPSYVEPYQLEEPLKNLAPTNINKLYSQNESFSYAQGKASMETPQQKPLSQQKPEGSQDSSQDVTPLIANSVRGGLANNQKPNEPSGDPSSRSQQNKKEWPPPSGSSSSNSVFLAKNSEIPSAGAKDETGAASKMGTSSYYGKVKVRRVTLSGSVEMTGGLAVTEAQDHIVVFRELNGLSLDETKVSMEQGHFEFKSLMVLEQQALGEETNSATSGGHAQQLEGRLVGQLRNGKGEVLGQGELDLASQALPRNVDRIDDLSLKIGPIIQGAQIEIVSAYSFGQRKEKVPHAQVWIVGTDSPLEVDENQKIFREEGVAQGSSFVLRAQADQHWGTLAVGLAGQENYAQLFPNRMVEALIHLTHSEKNPLDINNRSLIWGLVTKNGRPVAGVRLEMAGDHRVEPLYFNSLLLPDPSAQTTGENGVFAFLGAAPGIQSVRAFDQGRLVPAHVVPVERDHVSYLNFEIANPEKTPFELFDPFDKSREINARVRWAGGEDQESLEAQGRGHLSMPGGTGLLMMEVDAGDQFELTRSMQPRHTSFVHLPVVRRDWISSLAAKRRVNWESDKGLVVGFVMEDDFTVNIDSTDESVSGSSHTEIVYFDPSGRVVYGGEGVAGGGFILFNMPLGLGGLSIALKNSHFMQRHIFISEPGITNIIYK